MANIAVKDIFDLSVHAFQRSAKKRKEAEATANYPLTMSSGVSLGSIILIGVGGALLLHFIRGK